MVKSGVCELLGIEYPIIQGGMAWVADAVLAASVSNSGGLGIIAAGNSPGSYVEGEIIKAKQLTNKPFGVNVMLMSPFVDEVVDVVIKHKIKVLTTGAGNPGKYIERFKSINAKIIPVVASVALAKRMESIGADAIVAEGMESGGHVGELTTMVMIPQIADAVQIPVIAAGGIADGRGFAAALVLGAQAVQIGTRFLVSTECTASESYKQAIIKARDRDTIVTGVSTGHPVRVMRNKFARELAKMEKNGVLPKDLEKFGEGRLKLAVKDGDISMGSLMAGQISGLICDIKSVKEIILDIVGQAEEILKKMCSNL